jgi:hypothetical protein
MRHTTKKILDAITYHDLDRIIDWYNALNKHYNITKHDTNLIERITEFSKVLHNSHLIIDKPKVGVEIKY